MLIVVLLVSRNAPAVEADLDRLPDATPERRELRPPEAPVRPVLNRNALLADALWIGGDGLFSTIASWMAAILVESAGLSRSMALERQPQVQCLPLPCVLNAVVLRLASELDARAALRYRSQDGLGFLARQGLTHA